jgi:transposase
VVEPDDWCQACGCLGVQRDSVLRRLAHVPLGWRVRILHVRIGRYRCSSCGQVWRQDTTAAEGAGPILDTGGDVGVEGVFIDRMWIARIAAAGRFGDANGSPMTPYTDLDGRAKASGYVRHRTLPKCH